MTESAQGAGPARLEAWNVLERVRHGAGVSEALSEAGKRSLSPADRALMTQIVHGVLRNQRYLDAWLEPFLRGELDPSVRDILRMALFQIGFLDRVPTYAVVNAAVEQTKTVAPRATGMVNAILRRAPSQKPKNVSLGVEFSHPDWIVRRWQARYGLERTRHMLWVDNQVPPLTLRVNLGRIARETVLAQLQAQGVRAEASRYLPEAIRVSGPLWLEDLPAFQEGNVTVQDESAMLVTWALDPKPHERIVDLTAGLGGKTGHILEKTQGEAEVTAVDLAQNRLSLLRENIMRLGYAHHVSIVGQDSQIFSLEHPKQFDRVLLDAPCSNLGVLRRRSDARWRKQEKDLGGLATTQKALLDAAVRLLKPGGVLVYSTCSVEPEETTDVVRKVLESHSTVHIEPVQDFLPAPAFQDFTQEGFLTLLPGDLGMDGFFIARLRADVREAE
ncbi:MAG: 16S rRNA (cytosine(967)-C(5))-methyltransferase RsmB [Sulfobacillus thermosulfidooxidans]|nr:MAG: 16S rRNA (cytosine(967)-C(5))-methyltransferase RsmB [Sulfobacillus thermosulfidooxidans]